MRLRQLLPSRLRVAAGRVEQDARNVADALRSPRTRTCRVDIDGKRYDVDVELEASTPPVEARASEALHSPTEIHATLVFAHSGVTLEISDPTKTVLQAGLEAGVDLLYSCTLGGCAACILDVLEGEVEYDDPEAVCLTEQEMESGEVCLACVGRPRGRVVVEA